MTDDDIIADAMRAACPCGESGHPREQCDPGWLAEVDAVPDVGVPDVPSGGNLCWNCRRLVVYGVGPHSDFARRCDALLTARQMS